MIKRYFHFAVCVLVCAALITSCAPVAAPTTDIVRPDGQEVVLWHAYDGATRAALLQQVDEFNAVNPWHIVIVPEYHGTADQLTRTLKDSKDNGTLPDLATRPSGSVWALDTSVVPMQRYANDPRLGLTSDDLADIYPAMLDTTRDPKSDELVGFPLGGEGVVLIYNIDRLASANYFIAPNSWPLFREICQNTTKDTTGDGQVDVYGFGFTPRADFAAAWLNSRGSSIISDDGTHTTFNGDEGVRTLSTLQETAASGCFYRTTNEDAIREFARGKVAMIFALTTQLSEIFSAVEARGGFRWGVSPVPYGRRNPTLTVSGPAWIMLRSTPAKQLAAWLFVRWFAETSQTVRWSQLTGLLPLRKSAAQGLSDLFTLNAGFKVAFDLMEVAQAQPDIPQWGSIAELLVHAVNAAVDGNDATQVLNEAAKAADALLK